MISTAYPRGLIGGCQQGLYLCSVQEVNQFPLVSLLGYSEHALDMSAKSRLLEGHKRKNDRIAVRRRLRVRAEIERRVSRVIEECGNQRHVELSKS